MLARRTDKERLEQKERLVNTRREGKQIFYSIASKEALAVMQVLYQQFCAPATGENND